MPLAAEAEQGRGPPSRSARYGSGAIPMPPPTSSGCSTERSKPWPSGPSTWIASPAARPASARVPGPIGVDEEAELAVGCETERERAREHASGCLEHEELARCPRFQPAPCETQQRVRPDRARAEHPSALAPCPGDRGPVADEPAHATPMRSCSDSAVSARALAIAWTAAAAPAIVVMHGTRAMSAASRIR